MKTQYITFLIDSTNGETLKELDGLYTPQGNEIYLGNDLYEVVDLQADTIDDIAPLVTRRISIFKKA